MYDQKCIDSCGEKVLGGILEGTIPYSFSIDKESLDDRKIYRAFEHYLIKSFASGNHKNECMKFLTLFYGEFYKKPYLFCDSPLLKNNVINMIYGNSKEGESIRKYRNDYYSGKIISQLSKKREATPLNEAEKNRYYAILIHGINNPNNQEFIKKEIARIIDMDYKTLSDMQLKFYAQYVSNEFFRGKDGDRLETILIGKEREELGGYQSSGIICLNQRRSANTMSDFTHIICHETRHAVQQVEVKNKLNLTAFERAQRELFVKYLSSKDLSFYQDKTNYRYSRIELDAERFGYSDAAYFLKCFNRPDMADELYKLRNKKLGKRDYYGYALDKEDNIQGFEEFTVTSLDDIIKNNPEEINNYPVLSKLYNKDGSRKSFIELLNQRLSLNIDMREVLDYYIDYEIYNGALNHISLKDVSRETINSLTSALITIYNSHISKVKNYIQDNRIIHQKEQKDAIVQTTDYELKLVHNILRYIYDNYDLLNDPQATNSGSYNSMYNLIYELRDFDPSDIKNETIKNNDMIMDHLNRVLRGNRALTKKYNRTVLEDKLSKVPSTVREGIIETEDGTTIDFDSYCINNILPYMNSHQRVIIDGKEYSISDLINEYVGYVQPPELSESKGSISK